MKRFKQNYSKAITLAVIATSFLATGSLFAHGDEDSAAGPLSPHGKVVARGDKCVRDESVMRHQHFEFLLHHRDQTVRKGVRTTDFSLKNCVNCHADPKTNSVLGEKGFCQECHTYAAVSIDCFSCHTDKAEPGVKPIPAMTKTDDKSGDSK
jgi:hypothetical protein